MDTTEIMKLCNQIRETAYEIHRYHGTGYLEKVYENALAHRLKGAGMEHGLLINFGSYKFFIKKYARRAKTNPITKLASLLLPLFAFLAFFRG